MYNNYKSFIKENLFLRPYGVHGIGHTKRVLILASEIAKHYDLSEQENKILAFACCYHDIGRTNDLEDPMHGQYSSDKVVKLHLLNNKNLSEKEQSAILNLITMHCLDDDLFIGDDRNLLLYQIIKDADALDRVRFGNNDLDAKYLRCDESKELIQFAEKLFTNWNTESFKEINVNHFINNKTSNTEKLKEIETWAATYYPKTYDMKEENEWNYGLLKYKQGKYNQINSLLRRSPDFDGTQKCKDSALTNDIYSIYRLTKEKQLPNDITVYRYTTWSDFKSTKEPIWKNKFLNLVYPLKAGTVCKEKGFCSTSMDPEYMETFKSNFPFCDCLLTIHLPKGMPGVYYSFNASMHPNKCIPEEYEFLLPPCTRFRIDKINKSDKNKIIIECTALLIAIN